MPESTTFNVIYLGQLDIIDPMEGNGVLSETAVNNLLGTYGSEADPLYQQVRTWSAIDYSGGNSSDYDIDNETSNDTFQIDGGNAQSFDALQYYDGTITYYDGTSVTTTLQVAQDVNGESYIVPPASASSYGDALEAKAIESITLTSPAWINSDNFNGRRLTAEREVVEFACFTSGTLIRTPDGEVAIEKLAVGDPVLTLDEGYQIVRWIGSRRLSAEDLAARPNLRPIRIRAGALGEGTPFSDLLVSPQHRVLVRSKIAQNMFGTAEVLVAAKQLLSIEGIDVATDVTQVDYVHFLMEDHQVVISNGAETESLYTGPQALKSVGPAALEEIFLIFPELRDREPDRQPEGARTLLTGRQGREMAERHARKSRALVA
ncbi:Hint domain-containing protein [Paracoccus sp. (in: a-proteobacteria)]|uniref:Hint domain-containing protein n=1 Tax=Paracoccus sp. TaxID=267 RepID=UPI00405A368D